MQIKKSIILGTVGDINRPIDKLFNKNKNEKSGHFYLVKKRTFLSGVDIVVNHSCKS